MSGWRTLLTIRLSRLKRSLEVSTPWQDYAGRGERGNGVGGVAEPAREALTAVGPVSVRVPKVRDRSGRGVTFNSARVPPSVRRCGRISAAMPWRRYLKGVPIGDLQAVLAVWVGDQAKDLSANGVSRLKAGWAYPAWARRALSEQRYVYGWAHASGLDGRRDLQARGLSAGP